LSCGCAWSHPASDGIEPSEAAGLFARRPSFLPIPGRKHQVQRETAVTLSQPKRPAPALTYTTICSKSAYRLRPRQLEVQQRRAVCLSGRLILISPCSASPLHGHLAIPSNPQLQKDPSRGESAARVDEQSQPGASSEDCLAALDHQAPCHCFSGPVFFLYGSGTAPGAHHVYRDCSHVRLRPRGQRRGPVRSKARRQGM